MRFVFSGRPNALDARHFYFGQQHDLNVAMTSVSITNDQPDDDLIRSAFAEAAEKIPRFRQKLREAPMGLGRPQWIMHEDFDINDHVRIIECEPKLSIAEVILKADALHSSGFDLNLPLWNAHVYKGLESGGAALILRLHHSLSDGTALNLMMGRVFMAELFAGVEDDWETEVEDTGRSQVARLVSDRYLAVKAGVSSGIEVARTGMSTDGRKTIRGNWDSFAKPAPNGRIGRHGRQRRSVVLSVDEGVWRQTAESMGGNANDLYLAIVAASLRQGGVHNEDRSIRVAMPVNVRGESEDQDSGNVTGLGFVLIDGEVSSGSSLADVRLAARAAKDSARQHSSTVFDEMLDLLPGQVQAKVALRLYSKTDVLATNVVVPLPMKLGGAEVKMSFIQPTIIGAPVGCALITYDGNCYLSANVDLGIVPDVGLLGKALESVCQDVFGGDNVRRLSSI